MSIAALLARAKAATAPRVAERIELTRRVRTRDHSGATGFIIETFDGWVQWLADDGSSHLSRPDFLEEIA